MKSQIFDNRRNAVEAYKNAKGSALLRWLPGGRAILFVPASLAVNHHTGSNVSHH